MDLLKKKLEVLIISHEFPPFGGGAGIVAFRYCVELEKCDINVSLLTRRQSYFPNELKNININSVIHIPKLWFVPYYFLFKKINFNKYDLIILNDQAAGYLAGLYFNDDVLKKTVPILHGSEPEKIYLKPSFFYRLQFFKYFYQRMLVKSKKIIAVSNYMKKKFLTETSYNDADKIHVNYSGLHSDYISDNSIDRTNFFNFKNQEIILTVSRIEKNKGILEMYSLFKKLIDNDDNFIWIIVGDGDYKNTFRKLIIKDKLEHKIKLEGQKPQQVLSYYYKSADVFWLISKYKESFGLVYLEAQAFGCPAIGYNNYGVKEAILDGETGFLVNNVEECLEIFVKKRYRNIQKRDIKLFLNNFSPSNYQKSIIDILK